MPNSSVPVTPGAGANIATNDVGGLAYQVVKLDLGADGASIAASSDGTNGLDVHVKAVDGIVQVSNATPSNLKVDGSGVTQPVSAAAPLPVSAAVGAPAFVRLSDGTNPIATLPVSGTVTANQGTAAADASGWPTKITDGTNEAGLTTVGGQHALKVDVVQTVGAGAQGDKSAFTEGTTAFQVTGGEFNDSASSPSSGQAAAARITPLRGLHVNLRNQAGTEIGTNAAPVRTDPTGTTTQPVNLAQVAGNTVGTVVNGVQKVALADSGGNPIAAAIPLPVIMSSTPNGATRWRQHIAVTASQTGTAIRTPTTGKTLYILGWMLTLTVTGIISIFDNTDSATTRLYKGSPPVGNLVMNYHFPEPLAAINDVLEFTTGTGITGDLTVWGFEI